MCETYKYIDSVRKVKKKTFHQKTGVFGQKTMFAALFSGSKFSCLLTLRAEGAEPLPPFQSA